MLRHSMQWGRLAYAWGAEMDAVIQIQCEDGASLKSLISVTNKLPTTRFPVVSGHQCPLLSLKPPSEPVLFVNYLILTLKSFRAFHMDNERGRNESNDIAFHMSGYGSRAAPSGSGRLPCGPILRTSCGRLIATNTTSNNLACQSIPQHPSSMSFAGPVNTTHEGGNAQITNINGNVTYILSDDKADKIWKWLDAPDSSGNFLAAREKHHEQTGTWFIEGEEYLRWKETPDPALWVYGTPGCGKTIICQLYRHRTDSRKMHSRPQLCLRVFLF
ncbi:hypothetical protein FIBSPDRAFT_69905 [Athelia psychrophila]|uniref:Nephrocystin 3-like N-terminal domain-containing protein n=1 Tax=Athelia psychrophila TaxID=1759441 RepID=A0A166TT38_9AGAM|nr:hypothetical protein FIBSPDRAFT_69905 [Fibularhizoctonia sp. CBS 109695]